MDTCPFCGVAASSPHDTQEVCIAALHDEIARMRRILQQVHTVAVPRLPDDDDAQKAESGAEDAADSDRKTGG